MIVQRPGFESSVIVAGSFAAAGSLPCQSICAWDSNSFQWSPLGSGLQGTVGSVTFTGVRPTSLLPVDVTDGESFAEQRAIFNRYWIVYAQFHDVLSRSLGL